MSTRHRDVEIHAPHGSKLRCKGWVQEAALRMLMNNLDPEVAENPQELVVYGGIGRAARDWECYDAIVATLQRLENDETLLVQSGKPVGVFKTHEQAPRVLIANSPTQGSRRLRSNRGPAARRGRSTAAGERRPCDGRSGRGSLPARLCELPRRRRAWAPIEYPSLVGVGAASADFYLRTGRMPLAYPVGAATAEGAGVRRRTRSVSWSRTSPRWVTARRSPTSIRTAATSRSVPSCSCANCAACHNSAGVGGALSQGAHAPPLLDVDPTQIAEAMRVGPGNMPVFGPDIFDDQRGRLDRALRARTCRSPSIRAG